jgi:hypothetical protein
MANTKFYLGDNQLGLLGLKDASDSIVTDATVTASVFDNSPLSLGSATTPVREIQKLTPDAKSTVGTFLLGYHGDWTAALPYNESLVNIQAALVALDGIGSGNVVVTGKQLSDAAFADGMIFTFGRNFGEAFQIDFDFTNITGPTQNGSVITQEAKGVSEGCAIDLGSGKVGIPVPDMADIYDGGFVRIVGSRNYDGEWAYDHLLSTKSRVAITATFAYEEFDGHEIAYIGLLNGLDIAMPHVSEGNYYGIVPADLNGLIANDIAFILITAVSGAVEMVFSAKPVVQFGGE